MAKKKKTIKRKKKTLQSLKSNSNPKSQTLAVEMIKRWIEREKKNIAYNIVCLASHKRRWPDVQFLGDSLYRMSVQELEGVKSWNNIQEPICIHYSPEWLKRALGEDAVNKLRNIIFDEMSQPIEYFDGCKLSYVEQPGTSDDHTLYRTIPGPKNDKNYCLKYQFDTPELKKTYCSTRGITDDGQYDDNEDKSTDYSNKPNDNLPGQQLVTDTKGTPINVPPLPFPFQSEDQSKKELVPVKGEPGTIQYVVQQIGNDFFGDKNSKLDQVTIDYNHSGSSGKNIDQVKFTENQGVFPIVKEMLEMVFGEKFKDVKYDSARNKILLPKIAFDEEHYEKWTENWTKQSSNKTTYYTKYIENILDKIRFSRPTTHPKNLKELVFFAINQIQADYKAAKHFCKQDPGTLSNLIEYSKFTRQGIGNGNYQLRLPITITNNDYDVNALFSDYKSDIKDGYEVFYEESKINNDVNYINNGDNLTTDLFYNNLKYYSSPLDKKNWKLQRKNKTKLILTIETTSKTSIDITESQLDVYRNAATLAALEGNPFPSQNEQRDKRYLLHAHFFTVFEKKGRRLQDYANPYFDLFQQNQTQDFNPFFHKKTDEVAINNGNNNIHPHKGKKFKSTQSTTNAQIIDILIRFAITGVCDPTCPTNAELSNDDYIKKLWSGASNLDNYPLWRYNLRKSLLDVFSKNDLIVSDSPDYEAIESELNQQYLSIVNPNNLNKPVPQGVNLTNQNFISNQNITQNIGNRNSNVNGNQVNLNNQQVMDPSLLSEFKISSDQIVKRLKIGKDLQNEFVPGSGELQLQLQAKGDLCLKYLGENRYHIWHTNGGPHAVFNAAPNSMLTALFPGTDEISINLPLFTTAGAVYKLAQDDQKRYSFVRIQPPQVPPTPPATGEQYKIASYVKNNKRAIKTDIGGPNEITIPPRVTLHQNNIGALDIEQYNSNNVKTPARGQPKFFLGAAEGSKVYLLPLGSSEYLIWADGNNTNSYLISCKDKDIQVRRGDSMAYKSISLPTEIGAIYEIDVPNQGLNYIGRISSAQAIQVQQGQGINPQNLPQLNNISQNLPQSNIPNSQNNNRRPNNIIDAIKYGAPEKIIFRQNCLTLIDNNRLFYEVKTDQKVHVKKLIDNKMLVWAEGDTHKWEINISNLKEIPVVFYEGQTEKEFILDIDSLPLNEDVDLGSPNNPNKELLKPLNSPQDANNIRISQSQNRIQNSINNNILNSQNNYSLLRSNLVNRANQNQSNTNPQANTLGTITPKEDNVSVVTEDETIKKMVFGPDPFNGINSNSLDLQTDNNQKVYLEKIDANNMHVWLYGNPKKWKININGLKEIQVVFITGYYPFKKKEFMIDIDKLTPKTDVCLGTPKNPDTDVFKALSPDTQDANNNQISQIKSSFLNSGNINISKTFNIDNNIDNNDNIQSTQNKEPELFSIATLVVEKKIDLPFIEKGSYDELHFQLNAGSNLYIKKITNNKFSNIFHIWPINGKRVKVAICGDEVWVRWPGSKSPCIYPFDAFDLNEVYDLGSVLNHFSNNMKPKLDNVTNDVEEPNDTLYYVTKKGIVDANGNKLQAKKSDGQDNPENTNIINLNSNDIRTSNVSNNNRIETDSQKSDLENQNKDNPPSNIPAINHINIYKATKEDNEARLGVDVLDNKDVQCLNIPTEKNIDIKITKEHDNIFKVSAGLFNERYNFGSQGIKVFWDNKISGQAFYNTERLDVGDAIIIGSLDNHDISKTGGTGRLLPAKSVKVIYAPKKPENSNIPDPNLNENQNINNVSGQPSTNVLNSKKLQMSATNPYTPLHLNPEYSLNSKNPPEENININNS